MQRKTIIVSPQGGDYPTLTQAAAACAATPEEPVRFFLKRGVYEERPMIELTDYCIEGEDPDSTILSASVGGFDPWPGEAKTGTFRSWVLFLGGQRAIVKNLTVRNTAGDGAERGQALAVYADASRVAMYNVRLHGNQDTLFTAPLPRKEREINGFRGPRQDTPRLPTRQYYRDCVISGNIDFIFGGANAVFDHCLIQPVPHRRKVCYITAASTFEGMPGYLFANCTVQGQCAPGTVYLGRPWRAHASVFWLDCTLSGEVAPDGWDHWNDAANEETARFGESGSTGAGASPARAFGSVDDGVQAAHYREMLAQFRREFAPTESREISKPLVN